MTALYPPGGVATYRRTMDGERLARIEAQLDRLAADHRRRDAEFEAVRQLAAELGLIAGTALEALSTRLAALEERGPVGRDRPPAPVDENA